MRWRWPWQRKLAAAVDQTVVEEAVDAQKARVESERKLADARRTAIRVNRMILAHEELTRVDGLPGALAEALRRRPR